MLAMAMALAAAIAPASDCAGKTTVEVDQCLARHAEAADTQLSAYRAAARKRIQSMIRDRAAPASTLAKFDRAEKSWASYRKQQCAALYDYWSQGTIRGAMAGSCRVEVTRDHVRIIWRQWLRYEDSTPPILPDPDGAPLPR